MSVKRCTRGSVWIVEPPSVAAAVEIVDNACAVWNESIDSIEFVVPRLLKRESVLVTTLVEYSDWNVTRESAARLSSVVAGIAASKVGLGSAAGRIVRIEDKEGGIVWVTC
jgi:hypothetical protein